jgi:cell division protein FtsB
MAQKRLQARLRADLDLSYEVLLALKSDNNILVRRNERLRAKNDQLKARIIDDHRKYVALRSDLETLTRQNGELVEQNKDMASQIEHIFEVIAAGSPQDDPDGVIQLMQDLMTEVQKSHQEYWELHAFVRDSIRQRLT